MAISGGDGSIILTTKVDQTGLKQGLSSIKKIGATAGKAFLAIGAAAATATVAITKMAVSAYADYQQLIGGVETLFKGSADKVIAYAENAFATTGQSASEYMENVTAFSASLLSAVGGDTERAADVANAAMISISDNVNKMGSSAESVQLAFQGFAKQQYMLLDNLKLGYGGTKTEMQRLIKEAAALKDVQEELGITVDANSMSFDNIVNAIHVVQKDMGIAGATTDEAMETIEGSVNAAKAAWDNFLNGSISVEEFAVAFNYAVQNITENLGTIIPRLILAIPPMIASLAPILVQAGMDLVGYILNGLGLNEPQVIQQSFDMINEWVETGLSFLPTILDTGCQIIENLLLGLLDNAPGVIEQAFTMLTGWMEEILGMLPTIMQSGAEMILNLLNGLVDNAPEIISQAYTMLTGYIAMISKNLPAILQKGIEIIAQLLAGIIAKVPDLLAAIPGIVMNIGSAFLNTNWGSIGLNIIKGIANGIINSAGTIVNAAKSAAKKAFDAAKEFLGIKSPSRLFRDQIGKMMALGMGIGFEKNVPVKDMGYGLKVAVESLKKDAVVATSSGNGKTVGGIKGTPGFLGGGTDWDEWERRQRKLNKERDGRPVYLGTDRIDKELPKGAVPVW